MVRLLGAPWPFANTDDILETWVRTPPWAEGVPGSLEGQNTKDINGHKGNLHVGVTGRTVCMQLLSREQTPR